MSLEEQSFRIMAENIGMLTNSEIKEKMTFLKEEFERYKEIIKSNYEQLFSFNKEYLDLEEELERRGETFDGNK